MVGGYKLTNGISEIPGFCSLFVIFEIDNNGVQLKSLNMEVITIGDFL